jgi:hypothetical protein
MGHYNVRLLCGNAAKGLRWPPKIDRKSSDLPLMRGEMEGFTKLEEAALADVCLQCTTDQAAALTVQLSTAKVRSRENTGVGFYTRFDVARDRPIPGEWKRPVGWTYVEGLTRPMGFILWIQDGYADCLEGFTVDDSTVGLDLATMNFTLPFLPPI